MLSVSPATGYSPVYKSTSIAPPPTHTWQSVDTVEIGGEQPPPKGGLQGLRDALARTLRRAEHAAVDSGIDAHYEKLGIPRWEETGITDQSTSEDMTPAQFREFKKVERFAHGLMKSKEGKPPDLSRCKTETEKLQAILSYETQRQVSERFRPAIKRGVLRSLDSAATAGERYLSARELSDVLHESKAFAKETTHGLLDAYHEDPRSFLARYEAKYGKR